MQASIAVSAGVAATALALVGAGAAGADAAPVGPLPAGPAAIVITQPGELVAVALPHRSGRVWRIARAFDSKVVRQISEADVGSNVVLVFGARRTGTVKLAFALTKGETATKALESRTYTVRVR